MAAERANWRLILNCSKMSRGSGDPPGPTLENTKAWACSREKLAGPARAESWSESRGQEAGGRARSQQDTIGLTEAFASRALRPQPGCFPGRRAPPGLWGQSRWDPGDQNHAEILAQDALSENRNTFKHP